MVWTLLSPEMVLCLTDDRGWFFDETTRRVLKARAAARGESLNTYLLDLIEREVRPPTVYEVLDRAVQQVAVSVAGDPAPEAAVKPR